MGGRDRCLGWVAAGSLAVPGLLAAADEARTPVREDAQHRLVVHTEDYPREAVRAHEQGECRVALFVDVDGAIRAVQLLASSGHPRLDATCIRSVADDRLIPATLDGKPVAGWFTRSMRWEIDSDSLIPPHIPKQWPVPTLPDTYDLHVGPRYYPAGAHERGEEGICMVIVHVDADGAQSRLRLAKSTGFAELDRACTEAVAQAPFTPAQLAGRSEPAWAAITLFWRLR